ncbi:DDE-type integrase/transposase/recombinase [Candidatus Woesearchaeota archaeon]|nr:DDE-type integrase/transposase/recombinase [Candidatus Woesearchaeota archaeon]
MVEPKIKGNIHYDKKYVKVKNKDCYDLNAIDNKTKFILAHSFVDKRTKVNCINFLKQIKDNCYKQILRRYENEKHKKAEDKELIEFTCDKFANYKNAFNKLFSKTCKLNFGVPIACKKYNLKHNNNPIERYNGKIKDRIKNMRSGFKNFYDTENFMNLRRIINNYVNPHQELKGKTPAEEANIKLNLGRNKLMDLIKFVRNN